MTSTEQADDIEARIAQAWEELLNANAAVAAAVARREGAQRRYDALKREQP